MSVANVIGYTHSLTYAGEVATGVTTGTLAAQGTSRFWNTESDLVVTNLANSADLTIYDMKGTLVYRSTLEKGDNKENISSLMKGLYIVNIQDGSGLNLKGKLIK